MSRQTLLRDAPIRISAGAPKTNMPGAATRLVVISCQSQYIYQLSISNNPIVPLLLPTQRVPTVRQMPNPQYRIEIRRRRHEKWTLNVAVVC